MGVLLILPILVSGFLSCQLHPLHFYKLHRYEGQYLYLQSAKLGLASLIFAISLNSFLIYIVSLNWPCIPQLGPDYIHIIANYLVSIHLIDSSKFANALQISWLISISSIMLFIFPAFNAKVFEVLMCHKHQLETKEETTLWIMSELFRDSPLDNLLFNSLINQDQNLMLTMDDRKVYVGKVISMGEPNENQGADQEIAFMPITSGYRDKEDLTVTFTTKYDQIDKELVLILKQDQIISATTFYFDVYEKFQSLKAN